jgi:hypothetical protein
MKRRDNSRSLPTFETLDELVEFFDTHDLGEYDLAEAQFDVHIKRRAYLVAVDAKLAHQIAHIARAQGTSLEKLIHRWLREKIHEGKKASAALRRRAS